MSSQNPPPLVNKFSYQSCRQINQDSGRVYETPQGHIVPSVTTILSATKDMSTINKWRERVGHENADRITTEAAGVGTGMHANLERFILGQKRQPGNNMVHVIANRMADVIIHNGLKHIDEIWAIEQSLYFPELYSGTTDGIGVYKGEPAVFDYKQSNKLKKSEYVEDYRCQLVAYIMAHNEVYGTDIKQGHVFMCTRDLQYQQFDLLPQDYTKYQDMWLSKIEQYYSAMDQKRSAA
jgi:penicillin-binding protein-related factor A (putative recombinase)